MPNYVANEVTIKGSRIHVQNLLETIRNTESNKCIDFEKIIPMPKEEEDNWYDWRCENWGTKWNACNEPTLETTDNVDGDMIAVIRFETAWATPSKLIEKLSAMFPTVNISVKYADEDAGYNCGVYGLRAGIFIVTWQPEGGSKEAMEHYFSLWGGQEDWAFDEGTGEYEFIGE